MSASRATIYREDAEILEHRAWPGNQHVLRVAAPRAARKARPGSFAHITCAPDVPLRRPLSIMRADADAGWIEFLYKPVGAGLARLAEREVGERVDTLAPIGNGFSLLAERRRVIAIGGGVGIPPMVFLAERLRRDPGFECCVFMGSELPFPFDTVRSAVDMPGMPSTATHGMRLLEEWGVASRLASNASLPGSYGGHVPSLAGAYLDALGGGDECQIVACGPEPMLEAVARLAAEFELPCQLALEEYMACGVGGCAGCTVLVKTREGQAMKRVCVDGPVFEASEIYPAAFA